MTQGVAQKKHTSSQPGLGFHMSTKSLSRLTSEESPCMLLWLPVPTVRLGASATSANPKCALARPSTQGSSSTASTLKPNEACQ